MLRAGIWAEWKYGSKKFLNIRAKNICRLSCIITCIHFGQKLVLNDHSVSATPQLPFSLYMSNYSFSWDHVSPEICKFLFCFIYNYIFDLHWRRYINVFPHILFSSVLTRFMPLISFYTPRKHQKTRGFLMFSGGIERDQWHEMG